MITISAIVLNGFLLTLDKTPAPLRLLAGVFFVLNLPCYLDAFA